MVRLNVVIGFVSIFFWYEVGVGKFPGAFWNSCEQSDVEEFALHLIVLAHAYRIPALKRICTDSFEQGLLNLENVVDVLQISRYHLIS